MKILERYNLTVITPDGLGHLANVTEALHSARVKLYALSSFGDGQDYSIEIVLSDVENAIVAIEELGLDYDITGPRPAILVKGRWDKINRALADNYINIDQAYVAYGNYKAIVVSEDVYDEAVHILSRIPVKKCTCSKHEYHNHRTHHETQDDHCFYYQGNK